MTRRTKTLIPDDWNGEDWRCVVLQWPNSGQWMAVLRALITSPMRGRFWDERTGSIVDTQVTGREIEQANIPLVDCDGEEIPDANEGDGKEIVYIGIEREDEIMGWLCGVNPNAFKIENGVLFVKDFCGEWSEVGEMFSPDEVVDGSVWPDETPPAEYYGCGKAANLIHYLLALSDAAWANYDNPTTIEAAMRAAVPMATLSRARIYQWSAQIMGLDLVTLDWSHFNNETANQLARCKAAENVEDTAEGTGDERGAVVEAMASAYYNTIGIMTKDQWSSYWHFAAETIGDQDCRLILSLGAKDSEADCECPSSGVIIPETTWDYCYDLAAQQQGWYQVATNGTWQQGYGIKAITGTGAQGQFQGPMVSSPVSGTIEWVEVEFFGAAGEENCETFGYCGLVYVDDVTGVEYLIPSDGKWANGSAKYTFAPALSYGANSNQRIRFALRLESQGVIGWRIPRIRIAGTGTPLLEAPTNTYTP